MTTTRTFTHGVSYVYGNHVDTPFAFFDDKYNADDYVEWINKKFELEDKKYQVVELEKPVKVTIKSTRPVIHVVTLEVK